MISKNHLITDVIKKDSEFFFNYNKKHKWSVSKNNEEIYYVHFYPSKELTINDLRAIEDWTYYEDYVTYKSSDFKTVEADESFRELYQVVSSKLFNIDSVFDEIING